MSKAPIASGAKAPAAVTVPLSKPLIGHTGEIKEIPLREPTWGDYVDIGDLSNQTMSDPDRENQTFTKVQIVDDAEKLMTWMERLSGIESNILRAMTMKDGRAVTQAVKGLVQVTSVGN